MIMDERLPRLLRDERGMSLVFVSLAFMAFMAATTLAIDVGMFMVARNQAQNSADAGALAAAVALYYNDFNDRSASGPAVQNAISVAQANLVMGAPPSVLPSDVTFPNDPSGQPTRVAVQVFRSVARNNAIPTFIAKLIGMSTVDIGATATSEASLTNAATCVKPWTVPDKWIENSDANGNLDGPWTPNSTFDLYDNSGNPLPKPDVYIPVDQQGYSGYNAAIDKGTEVVLKPNNANKTAPSFYNEWAIPPGRGGSWYRDNISMCNSYKQAIFDLLTMEPGNKVGPTDQGTQELIDLDPGAYWDTGCSCVKGSAFATSPRVGVVPVYDPVYYETGKHNGRNASLKVANWIGVFVEGESNGNVTGRIVPAPGLDLKSAGAAPAGAFLRQIRLVQ